MAARSSALCNARLCLCCSARFFSTLLRWVSETLIPRKTTSSGSLALFILSCSSELRVRVKVKG